MRYVLRVQGMKWFFDGVRRWVGLPIKAKLMSPAEFTEVVVGQLREQASHLTIQVIKPLEIKVSTQADGDADVLLDNAYQAYQLRPNEQAAILKTYVKGFLEVAGRNRQVLDVNRILPVLKPVEFMDQVKAQASARGHDVTKLNPICEPYNSELIVLYAEDTANTIRYFPMAELEEAKVDVKNLRGIAVENLRFLLPNIKVEGGAGFFGISVGGEYEASLLLLNSLWTDRQIDVDGDYVVAVPARDILLVTGSKDERHLKELRRMAAEVFAQATYRLSPELFVYQEGKFELLAAA